MQEEIKEYTTNFHNLYEKLAPNYGYETRKDTKELDFNSNNGKLMYAVVDEIISPLLNNITNLQEENIKLKELCDKYEEEHNTKFNEWVFNKRENERLINELNTCMIERNNYLSRNEKAIEYLEHEQFKRILLGFGRDKYLENIKNEAINILKGVDKE